MSRFLVKRATPGAAVPAQATSAETSERHWDRLLKTAVALAHAAGDPEDAIRWALGLIRDYCGWPLGHAFLLEGETGTLASTRVWDTTEQERFAPFIDESEMLRLADGIGMPGRIIATGKPVWISDVQRADNFPRRDAARAAGIRSAAGVPIPSSRGVLGVLEFFSDVPEEYDADLLDFVAHVGSQLGVILDRNRDVRDRRSAEAALKRSEEDLAAAQRLAHIGSWSWDVGDDKVKWSAELHRIYGIVDSAGPVSFEEYISRVHPEDRERVASAVRNTIESLQPLEHEYRIVWPDGRVRWVHAAVEVSLRDGQAARRLSGFCHDITERREAEERRAQAQEELTRHQQMLERVARGERVDVTLDALCRDVEERFPDALCSVLVAVPGESMLRHAAAPSLPLAFRTAIDGLAIAEGSGACGTAAARGEDVVVADALNDRLTHAFIDLAAHHNLRSVWSHPLFSSTGDLLGTFAVYRPVRHKPDQAEIDCVTAAGSIAAVAIERSVAEKALTAAARIDPLTGLANRAAFLNALSYRLSVPDARVAVMFLDLDGFKWINDSIGHPLGDRLLVEVAWRFENALDGHHLLARFGGDEFTVLVEDSTPDDLSSIAETLADAMRAPFLLEGGEFFLSVSIGIATNEYATTAYELVRDADTAMYAAKSRGRARHVVFDEALRDRALERVTTETELRRALDRDELVMNYQPIIRLADGRTTGVESLVRWQHPTRGLLSPDRFIPLAEENGLIIALGERVLEHVLQDMAAYSLEHDLNVAVNVSALQLGDPDFCSLVGHALECHGFSPSRLLLEVTETGLMQQVEVARASLQAIVDLGVRVLIDDFGTGYSSLARLAELPVYGVKIDRGFSADVGRNDNADKVLAAIAGIARAMDLAVVVEGIETPEAAARVRALGCDYAQGFHFARPTAMDDLVVQASIA